jgi:hypothetical protein
MKKLNGKNPYFLKNSKSCQNDKPLITLCKRYQDPKSLEVLNNPALERFCSWFRRTALLSLISSWFC